MMLNYTYVVDLTAVNLNIVALFLDKKTGLQFVIFLSVSVLKRLVSQDDIF